MISINQVTCLSVLIAVARCSTFSIDTEADPIFNIDEKFISTTLDSSNIANKFKDFDFSDPRLIKLLNHLTPTYFRIGGTTADSVVFSADGSSTEDVVLSGSDWLRLNEFSEKAGARLIFDLNSLQRNADGSWNSENAEEMIKFSSENLLDLDWELGNEPDLYNALFGKNVDANQLGNDYNNLRDILNKYDLYKSSLLIGPDMFDVGSSSSVQDYLSRFLETGGDSVEAVTWHQYYFPGDSVQKETFLNPDTFNYLEQRSNVVKDVVTKAGKSNKIWMGETSSAYKGGAPNMSDRFLATFLWLDKLGLAAKLGNEVVIRQTFYGYNYALVDNSSSPNPDWWLSVLHKNLVGTKVLSTNTDAPSNSKIRLYAHCAKPSPLWDNSAVVVFGLNLDDQVGSFELGELESDAQVYFFEFTSESSLDSQLVRLNGDVLYLTPDLELPKVPPRILQKTDSYDMAPLSMGFWIFTNTNVKACQ